MKVKAPEKIYIHVKMDKVINTWNNTWIGVHDIEYTRTDAFIEKAEVFLYEKLNSGEVECGDIIAFINDFRNYMKG